MIPGLMPNADSDSVSLPDSVKTDDEKQSVEERSDVSLPESVNSTNLETQGELSVACCSQKCARLFAPEDLETYKLQLQQGSDFQEIQARKFEKLKDVFKSNDEKRQQKGLVWSFQGKHCCRKFWEAMHSMSPGRVDKLLKLCRSGATTLPKAAPKAARTQPAKDRVGLWFLEVYQHLADPLATPGSEDRMPQASMDDNEMQVVAHEIVDDIAHPLYSLSFNAGGTSKEQRLAGKRYVNFATVKEFFRFYQTDVATESQVSTATFERCYHEAWAKYIILRSPSTGNKCTICLKLEDWRSQCTTDEERLQVDLEKQQHLDVVKKDRSVNTRGNLKGGDLSNFKPGSLQNGFLKIQIDGMDQQKFNMPRARRLCGTADYGKSWKANVHVIGVILWGIAELYFLQEMDRAKDASMQCTVLARALDLAKQYLQKMDETFDIPSNCIIGVDNTPRESKNQVFFQYCGWLTGAMFETLEVQYLQVSHTHNEIDQRFSSMASVIKKAECLESLGQLKDFLIQHMRPAQGRVMHIEVLQDNWNFNAWLQQTSEATWSGLTSTKSQGANHLWRFCRRQHLGQEIVECSHEKWKSWPEDPNDICVTVKQYMSDPEKSQPPEVLMPARLFSTFLKANLQPAPRNTLSETTLMEFRKTAKLVGSDPWNLLEAQSYLEELCDKNERADSADLEPPHLTWVFSREGVTEHRLVTAEALQLDDVEVPAPEPPRKVQVKAKAKPKVFKRPSTADSGCSLKRPAAGAENQALDENLALPSSSGTKKKARSKH